MQGFPVFNRFLPSLTCWGVRATFDIVNGDVIYRHHTNPCACFNGHVTDGHTPLHAHVFKHLSTKFNGMTCTTCCANFGNDGKHDIFGRNPLPKFAIDFNEHIFHFLLNKTLSRQHMFHFRCANAMCQTAQRPMCGSMTVTTHHGHTRKYQTLFRSNHMDNALTNVIDGEFFNPKLLTIII